MRPLLLLLCLLPLQLTAEVFEAEVVYVADGDSLTISRDGRRLKVRLADIDAPEWDQPWGRQSRASLRELLDKRKVRMDSRAVDQYGRTIAHISIGDRDINREQVGRGMAWSYAYRSTEHPYRDSQDEARAAGRGLWSQSDPQPPWRWRKAHPRKEAAAPAQRSQPVMLYDLHCGAKKRCKQMRSCDEAYFYLLSCGVKSLDGDGDGIPCSALCPAQGG